MKKIAAWLLALLMLSGCAAQPRLADPQGLAEALVSRVEFRDELVRVDESIAKMLYGIDTFSNAYVYVGSGATAEEVAVFSFAEEIQAETAVEKAQERIANQMESYAAYIPEEAHRLKNAVVKQYGNCLVVCVSDGDRAEEIIGEYLK